MNTTSKHSAFSALLLTGVIAIGVTAQEEPPKDDLSVETNCLLMVLDQVELAARRDGIIEDLHARMGDEVKEGALLIEFGLSEAKARLAVAEAKLEQAQVLASDLSGIEAAKIQLIRTAKELRMLEEVGKVPFLEKFRAASEKSKSHAELEIARKTHEEAVEAASVASAEVRLAAIDVSDRTVRAPVAGTVVKQFKFRGEWCRQGDPVVKILRMDRLMLQGIINIKEVAPHNVAGMDATASFELAGENPVVLTGLKVEKVNPEIDLDGNYVVWTSVDNKKGIDAAGNPRWLLRPGISGSLKITNTKQSLEDSHLNEPTEVVLTR